MCKDMEVIISYIDEHRGEIRPLGEWINELNSRITPARRMTPRQYGRVFSVIRKKRLFEVERKVYPVVYCFN